MASNEEVVSTLNDLIETCRDGQEGFRTACDAIRDAEFKELLLEYSRQREGYVGALQDEVRRLGGDPETTGSVAATLHRGWMGLKAAITGGDDDAILAECERGDETAITTYRAALGTDMPASVRALVERQFAEIREARDRFRTLQDGRRPGT
jgi:uncharacterized protein (TIGR02284 family)